MIVTIGTTKGGVGKSTIAVNLAIGLSRCGFDVLLIDGDSPQETALAFTQLRSERLGNCGYTAIALHGGAIRTQIRQQLAKRYDHIVIDVGGRDTSSLRAALTVSDLVVIPVEPRSFDLWGADSTAELVREAKEVNDSLRAISVLNCADSQGNNNREAIAQLETVEGIEVSSCFLVRRKAFPNAADQGLSVLEYKDSSNPEGAAKASAEFSALFASLFPSAKKEGSPNARSSEPKEKNSHKRNQSESVHSSVA